jgi:PAS domain S-box-containing protein
MKHNRIRALQLAVFGEVAYATVLHANQARAWIAGQRDPATVLAIVGLGWQLVLLTIALGARQTLRSAQAAATREQQALTGVAGVSREWVWEADRHLRLTYSNDRVGDLLGYEPADLHGRMLPTLLADGQDEQAARVLAAAVEQRTGWDDVELLWRHADGHSVVLQGSAVPIVDGTGAITGFRGARRALTYELCQQRSLAAARSRLEQLLAQGALDIALQPIVDLASGRAASAEALARFHDGRSPDSWFREARETGQGVELDLLAFRAALNLFPQLPDPVCLSVNATPALLTDPRLTDAVLTSGVPLHRLVIEITEHVEIFRYDEITVALAPLRERGVRLAIDDTGAGYASFSHVLQLRPDIIKIDRSLVARVHLDPARRSLITALVLLALDLGAAVTAEGVEEPGELETLRDLGIDHVQGYLLGRPSLDRADWLRWWRRDWNPRRGASRAPVRRLVGRAG